MKEKVCTYIDLAIEARRIARWRLNLSDSSTIFAPLLQIFLIVHRRTSVTHLAFVPPLGSLFRGCAVIDLINHRQYTEQNNHEDLHLPRRVPFGRQRVGV